ncbi:MAG: transcription termination/antitermination protein NusG [Vigna little leaf phytoplasma]|nr:transcription termination/antitermination protein NusG [Vigna little leaf phytoplasma]
MEEQKIKKNVSQIDSKKSNIDEAKWYVIQTYSGYENSVREDLLKIANKGDNFSKFIFDVICPKEQYFKLKSDGSKQKKEKKMFSGYVFVKMIVTDYSWFVVRNLPKVTGFLGSIKKSNTMPIPLSENEIKPILIKSGLITKPNYNYLINKQVEITNGSFSGQKGKVILIDNNQDKMIVEIDLFGRLTPIEISFTSFKEVI